MTVAGTADAASTRGLTVQYRATASTGAPIAGTLRLYAKSYALVIGNDIYTGGWGRLSQARNDARRVAGALRKRGFDVALKLDLNSKALEQAFEDFFLEKGADPEARLFVWYAGHGHTMKEEGYLVPTDGALPTNRLGFLRKAISLRDFGKFMRLAESKHVFTIFDSCFAGTIFNVARATPPPAITRVTAEPVRQFMTSGDADQTVSDDGTFAKLFVDSLEGKRPADANGDGYLTASELGLHMTDAMSNYTRNAQTPRHGKMRDPELNKGDFVFRLASARPGGGVSLATPAASVDRDALFWNSIKDSNDADMFQEYLRQHPNGGFAGLARLKIKKLKAARQLAASAPPKPKPKPAPVPVKPAVGVFPKRAGQVFRDCADCPEMVVIPAGSFRMGDLNSGGYDDEKPVHRVTIPRPFAVGKYEVTRGEFSAFVNDTGYGTSGGCYYWTGSQVEKSKSRNWRSPGFSQTDRDPVVCVNWDDAKAYVRWLSRKVGKEYRLPSESEWEYMARAGGTAKYPFGDSEGFLCEYGNGADRSTGFGWKNKSCSDGYGEKTAPVGSFKPNNFRVYDTVGNASEWVEDCWHDSYRGAPSGGDAWTTGGNCRVRVLRGGSWVSDPGDLRSAVRVGITTGNRYDYVGFRVARTL